MRTIPEVWAHADQKGSTVATSDANGAIIDKYTYSAYGESGPEGNSGFPFRFTGQKLDAVTGLYNFKARWYDPVVGRFLQTDPIGYGDGMNLYAYTGGDPINFSDPTGTFKNWNTACTRIENPAFTTCGGAGGGIYNMGGIIPTASGEQFGLGVSDDSYYGDGSIGVQLGGRCIGAFGPCTTYARRRHFGDLLASSFEFLFLPDYNDPLGGSYFLETLAIIPAFKVAKAGKVIRVVGKADWYVDELGRAARSPDGVVNRFLSQVTIAALASGTGVGAVGFVGGYQKSKGDLTEAFLCGGMGFAVGAGAVYTSAFAKLSPPGAAAIGLGATVVGLNGGAQYAYQALDECSPF